MISCPQTTGYNSNSAEWCKASIIYSHIISSTSFYFMIPGISCLEFPEFSLLQASVFLRILFSQLEMFVSSFQPLLYSCAFSNTLICHIFYSQVLSGEGNGTPFQYSCLENTMDRGTWYATVHGVAKSQTQLSDFTFTFTKCLLIAVTTMPIC